MGDIIGKIQIKGRKRLEELEEGLELSISNLCVKNCLRKERYILKFQSIAACYCSNYWLEKEIEGGEIDLNFEIKIKFDKIKQHQININKDYYLLLKFLYHLLFYNIKFLRYNYWLQ